MSNKLYEISNQIQTRPQTSALALVQVSRYSPLLGQLSLFWSSGSFDGVSKVILDYIAKELY